MENQVESKINGYGIAGFVMALVSLIIFPYVLGVLGIVFGAMNSESGLGQSAVIIGIISIILKLALSCAAY